MNAGAVKANCCTSPLFSFRSLKTFIFSPSFSTSPSALNMEELICSFCKQHLILFIFLLVFPTSLSQAGLCCQALPEQRGCQEWWMTINLLLSSTTLLGDLQARWLPGMKTNLSFSFFPPFLHPCLPRSFRLTPSVSTSRPLQKNKKKIFRNGEMCAKQHRNLCADTGKRLLLLRVIVDVSEGNSMFRMIRSVFDSLSCPSSSSSSPLLPAPSQTYSTYIHPHSSCC